MISCYTEGIFSRTGVGPRDRTSAGTLRLAASAFDAEATLALSWYVQTSFVALTVRVLMH